MSKGAPTNTVCPEHIETAFEELATSAEFGDVHAAVMLLQSLAKRLENPKAAIPTAMRGYFAGALHEIFDGYYEAGHEFGNWAVSEGDALRVMTEVLSHEKTEETQLLRGIGEANHALNLVYDGRPRHPRGVSTTRASFVLSRQSELVSGGRLDEAAAYTQAVKDVARATELSTGTIYGDLRKLRAARSEPAD